MAIYISTFRHSFFPPSGITINPFNPIKSVEEKQYLRSEAEDRLRSHIPGKKRGGRDGTMFLY